MPIRIGRKASAEQFGPRELLDFSLEAEDGLDVVSVRPLPALAPRGHVRAHRAGQSYYVIRG